MFSMSLAFLRRVLLMCAGCATACAREVPAPRKEMPFPTRSVPVLADLDRRQQPVLKEIASLGPAHAWAGRYYVGDGFDRNVMLLVAPDAGCVASWVGCLGLYG